MNVEPAAGPAILLPGQRELTARLDRLELPSDAKALLAQLGMIITRVGGQVLRVGAKILYFALEIIKVLPGVTLGLVVGATMTAVISSVPLLGPVLGSILGPLLMAFGIGMGALSDMRDGEFAARLRLLISEFQELLGG